MDHSSSVPEVRVPVKIMATSRRFAAAITSASGSIPGLDEGSRPRAGPPPGCQGKQEPSDATADPFRERRAFWMAIFAASTGSSALPDPQGPGPVCVHDGIGPGVVQTSRPAERFQLTGGGSRSLTTFQCSWYAGVCWTRARRRWSDLPRRAGAGA